MPSGAFVRTMNKKLLYSLIVFAAGASYGFIVPVIKIASSSGIFPHTFLPVQYFSAIVVCSLGVLIFRKRPKTPKSLWKVAFLGLFTGGTSICYYTSVSMLPSSVALTMLFQYVWVGILIDCVVNKKLPSLSSIVSAIIVLVGTFFAAGIFDGSFSALNPIGIAFGAGSAIFWALYLNFSGTIGTDEPVLVRTLMLAIGGFLFTSITNPAAYVTAVTDPSIWPYAIALSVMGILAPTAMINFASPHLSAETVSIMASSELPVGILAAWAIVHDNPTPFALLGTVLVLVGIVSKQIPDLLKGRLSETPKS